MLEDVIILELPELEFISNLCFVKISRGNSYKELNITDEEIDLKNKLDFCEFLLREQRFRVDKIKKDKNSTILRIYGDFQKKVDKFLVNANFTYELWKRKQLAREAPHIRGVPSSGLAWYSARLITVRSGVRIKVGSSPLAKRPPFAYRCFFSLYY